MRVFARKITIIFVIVIVVTCFSSGVFGAYNYYTCKKTDSKTYCETSGGILDSAGYDYGTSLPFDDASATAQSFGAGSNYVYLSLRFGTSGTYSNSFTKFSGKSASLQYVATDYDNMTGTIKAKNSNLNGVQLSITN